MSITPVPISIRFVRAPTAASRGKGDASCRAKWCTRKYAPSAPSSSAATASSMDCRRASAPVRVCEPGDCDQWPNERNPIFFIPLCNTEDGPDFRSDRQRLVRHQRVLVQTSGRTGSDRYVVGGGRCRGGGGSDPSGRARRRRRPGRGPGGGGGKGGGPRPR